MQAAASYNGKRMAPKNNGLLARLHVQEPKSLPIFEVQNCHHESVVCVLSPFYYKTGTMGRIGSTSYVLPIRLSYRKLNRAMSVSPNFY